MNGGSSSSLRPRRVLVAALGGVFVTAFPSVILVATLPAIARDLGTTESVIAWVVTAPMVVGSVLLPTFGRVGDVIGHRRVFLLFVSIAGVASALCALAWDPVSLIAFRTISQAVGTASLPAAIALLMATYQGEARTRSLGYWAFVSSGSPSLGLAFGGPLVAGVGWRGVFACQAFVALVAVLFARPVLSETPRRSVRSYDVAGGLCLMVATGAALVGLDRLSDWGPGHPVLLVCVALVPVGAVAFALVERHSRDPMLPTTLLGDRRFAAPVAVEMVFQASSMGMFFVTPFILHDQFGQDAARTALLMLPLPVGMCVFSPLGGRLSWRLGSRATALLGGSLLMTSVGLVALAVHQRSLPLVLVGLTVQGMANGLARPATSSGTSYALDEASMGVGMATMRMLSQVGAATGITVAVATTRADGTGRALLASAILGALGSAIALLIHRPPSPTDPETTDRTLASTMATAVDP